MKAEAPLSATEVRIGEIHEHLFQLEGALLRRLETVHARDHGACNQLLELLRKDGEESFGQILTTATEYRETVSTPSAFRPGVKNGKSLLARLWGLVQKQNDDALNKPAKALATALDLPDSNLENYESVVSILRRPTFLDKSVPHRVSRNLLVTMSASFQIITAAAHSDQYEAYPVALLRSISFDLRRSMSETEKYLLDL
jgi:hypothetical protein